MVGSRNRVIIMGLLMGLLVAFAGHAFAAKGGNGGGKRGGASTGDGGLSLVLMNGDTEAQYGHEVTFTVTNSATTRPFVYLECLQNGARVYGFSAGIFPDYPWTQIFTLRSDNWTGGAADCTATLFYTTSNGQDRVLGTLSVPVSA